MSPAEIRASLRDGTIDPFDLVARDGSSVRRELVEVDEIFFSSKVVYADSPQQVFAPSKAAPAEGNAPAQRDSTQVSNAPAALSGDSMPLGVGQVLALAERRGSLAATQVSSQDGGGKPRRKNRRDPKRYYLMDGRGRVLGPVSAGDVQSMYYKGVLDRSVRVMKDGSTAQVPVAKFVGIYSEQARGGRPAPSQAAHPAMPMMAPPPRMAMGLGPTFFRGPLARMLAIGGMVAALVIAGLAVLALYRSGNLDWLARKPPRAAVERRVKKSPARALPKNFRGVLPRPDGKGSPYERQAPARKAAVKTPKREARAGLTPRQRQFEEFRKARAAATKIRANKQKKAELAKQEKKALAAKPAPYVPKPVAAFVKKPPVAAPLPAAAPKPSAAPAPASGLAGTPVGQTVSAVGPMTFNKNAVETCDGGCTVTFSGAPGSVRVKFFKEVWGPSLMAKDGGVRISGLMREDSGGKFILLSNVE